MLQSFCYATAYDFEVDGIYYNLSSDGKTCSVVSGSQKYSGDITIPSEITYNSQKIPVTSIGNEAFWDCSGMTSVSIGNSVTSIGKAAFWGCSGLTSVTIPNSVTFIGYCAFQYCSGLTSATIPNSVTSIGDGAFLCCSGLIEITVTVGNQHYTSDNGVLFNKDKSIILTYPGGKTGAYTVPNSVTSIGIYAFSLCSGLTSVIIPNSVTSIGEYAFYNCSGLTSVTIGHSVTSIGEYAFYECPASEIYITTQTPPEGNPGFGNPKKLYVQGKEALEAYKNAKGWKKFGSYEVMVEANGFSYDGPTAIWGHPDEQVHLTASLLPEDVTLPHIFWSSTNPDVATVDHNGLVTFHNTTSDDIMTASEGDDDSTTAAPCKIIGETLYANGPKLEITVEDPTTRIEEIKPDAITSTAVYDLRGVKVGESTTGLPHGVYIVKTATQTTKVAI